MVDDYEEVAEEEFKAPGALQEEAAEELSVRGLSNAPFCSHLTRQIWVLVNACRMVRCEPSKVLLVEDESAEDMYVVEVGAWTLLLKVKVLLTAKHMRNIMGKACLKDEPLQASLISSDESITWALDAETLRRT